MIIGKINRENSAKSIINVRNSSNWRNNIISGNGDCTRMQMVMMKYILNIVPVTSLLITFREKIVHLNGL